MSNSSSKKGQYICSRYVVACRLDVSLGLASALGSQYSTGQLMQLIDRYLISRADLDHIFMGRENLEMAVAARSSCLLRFFLDLIKALGHTVNKLFERYIHTYIIATGSSEEHTIKTKLSSRLQAILDKMA